MARGPLPRMAEAAGGAAEPPGWGFIAGLLRTIDVMFAVMPARIKLELSSRIKAWAEGYRQDALSQLGEADPDKPAPAPGPRTYTTQGSSNDFCGGFRR